MYKVLMDISKNLKDYTSGCGGRLSNSGPEKLLAAVPAYQVARSSTLEFYPFGKKSSKSQISPDDISNKMLRRAAARLEWLSFAGHGFECRNCPRKSESLK
jgi:hypothetical protein